MTNSVISLQKKAVMQTNIFGPLVTFGSWVCGRSIPENVYATSSWGWLKTPLDEEHTSL